MKEKQLLSDKTAIKWAIFLGVVVAFLLPGLALAQTPFSDDFEAYNLGDLYNQGQWAGFVQGRFFVQDINVHTGTKALHHIYISAIDRIKKWGDSTPDGLASFWFNVGEVAEGSYAFFGVSQYTETFGVPLGFSFQKVNGKIEIKPMQNEIIYIADLSSNVWHKGNIEWEIALQRYKIKVDDLAWSDWFSPVYAFASIDGFEGASIWNCEFWLDDIGIAGPPPTPEAKISIITPENESTLTDLENWFSFDYEGLDPEIFKEFSFEWWDEDKTIILASRTLLLDGEGYYSHIFRGFFNFEVNGKHFLRVMGITKDFEILPIEIDPVDYWILLDVEGLPDFFEMLPWDTWYIENSGYDEPTAIFSGIASLIGPIFDKVGNFGNRIKDFLNTDEAHQTGYSLGIVFPTFSQYVKEIEVFFGDFPIITILKIFLILLLGIFIFRLILKFIPGLGG